MRGSRFFRLGIIAAVVVCAHVPVQAQRLADGFDDDTAGAAPPSPWSTWGTAGTTHVDDAVYRGAGGHSLKIERQLFDGSFFAAVHPYTTLEGNAELTYYFMLSGPTTREAVSVFGRDSSDNMVAWWVAHGGYFGNAVGTYSDSQGWTHIMDVVNDTWYGVHLDIDADAYTFDITIWQDDDPTTTATVTDLDFRNGAAADAVDEIQIGDFHPGYVGEERYAWVDDLLLIGRAIFADDFESGDPWAWSNMDP